MKSYDEIAKELKEVKGQVEALNNQVSQMATNMANAVKASIPLKDIEKELLAQGSMQADLWGLGDIGRPADGRYGLLIHSDSRRKKDEYNEEENVRGTG